jgi:quercetin dioxygenase-like cupin family protein
MTLYRGRYHPAAEWPESRRGARRAGVRLAGDAMMIVQFRITKDAEVPAHSHPHEQIGHVVSGQMLFRIGDEVRELGPGRRLPVPGVVHGATGHY